MARVRGIPGDHLDCWHHIPSPLTAMLSTQVRLRVQFLCARIERGEPVAFQDMAWLEKWSTSNRSVYDMVSRARRRAVTGPLEPGSMDEFLDGLNLGDPDPSNHLTGDSSIDDLAAFFKAPDWTRRD